MTAPVHPTVPYGQPGQVGFDGRAPGAPAPNAPAPAAPAAPPAPPVNQPFAPPAAPAAPAAPHPTAPFGQPGFAPPAAPAPAGPTSGVDPNQVIQAAPGVPAELVGRTVGQAFQIYSALASEWIRRTPQGGGTQAPPAAPGQPAPAQPQAPGAAPGAPRPAAGDFWRDPEANITRIVREQVAAATAPANAAAQEQEVIRARDIAIAGIPDVQQLWPTMVATLQGVEPSGLTDPRVWERAADMARGQLMKAGQYRPVGAPAAPNGAPPAPQNQPFTAAGGRPSIPGGHPGAAVLPQTAFFTESPSTPGAGGPYNPGLTAEEANVAQKFGMSPQDYAAWKGGVSRGR